MIIEYDIACFERTLQIKLVDGYEHLEDEILEMLDKYYDEWHNLDEIEDEEERMAVHDACLEEYMMDRLSETYDIWENWDSIYYGDEEE